MSKSVCMNMLGLALALSIGFVIMVVMYSKLSDMKAPPAPTWYEQTCLNCGLVWDCSQPGPETMEWCVECGKFCWTGYNLFQNVLESKGSEEAKLAMLNHCKVCIGCRGALYSPESWRVEIRKQMEILH